jgi:hypothetical protein
MELEWRETVNAGGDPVWIAYTDNKLYKLVITETNPPGSQGPWYWGEIIFRPDAKVITETAYQSPKTGMRGLVRRLAKY